MRRFINNTLVAYGFTERQFMLLKRYWMWEVVWIIYSICMTLSIGFLGSGVQGITGAQIDANRLILYLVTGSLLWGYISGLFWEISNTVGWERWEGTIEYTFMAPISRIAHIAGISLFSVVYGVLRTLITLAVLTVFFHLDLSNANLGAALLVVAVSSFSFVGFGTMAAVLPLMSPEKGTQITGIIEGIMLMVSGVYYETSVLPNWMQYVSTVSPATYTLRGMRRALIEGAGVSQLSDCLLPLVVMGIVLLPVGVLIFKLGERHCKRTGKLKRSG